MASGFIDVINKIIKFFKTIQKRFVNFGKGTTGFGGGLLAGIIAVFEVFKVGGSSLINNTGTMMEVVWKYVECTGEFIYKLPQCFVLHLINLVITLTYYLFFRLPVMLIELALGISLEPELDMLWSLIRTGDDVVYGLTGIYLTQLPPSMVKRCYSCGGKKYSAKMISDSQNKMEKAGKAIQRDFNVKIPKLFRRPKSKMDDSIKRLKKVFA